MGGVAVGGPVMGPEPDGDHGRRGDDPVGEGGGRLVVPEEGVAVLDRGAGGPDVAALDRELPRLLVLGDADQGPHLLHRVGRLGHATTPASWSWAIWPRSRPAASSSS